MKYDEKEQGLRISLNTEELPFDGYYIGGNNYYRRIDNVDYRIVKTKGKTGFALVGGWEDKQSTILFDDILYLAVCREQGQKDLYYLFTIKKGVPTLIKHSKAQKGAIKSMWKQIEEFIAQRPKVSLQQLFNAVEKLNADPRTLQTFSVALHSYSIGHEFDANYELPKTTEEQMEKTLKKSKEIDKALKFYRKYKDIIEEE